MSDTRFDRLYQWREENPEAFKTNRTERTKSWRKANPEKAKAQYAKQNAKRKTESEATKRRRRCKELQKRYGITFDRYDEILEKQDNRCAICACQACPSGRSFAVDHDHDTGEVRGLLCKDCNIGLGMFKDDKERLRSAALYLERT